MAARPGPLGTALALALAYEGLLQALGLYRYSYDAYTHIFFAGHYMRDWFQLWDDRWYGGFTVASYPPLVHQLMALVGYLAGPAAGFQVLSAVALALLAYSSYLFAGIYLGGNERRWAPFLALLMPSVGLTLNAFGQLPTLFSTAFALLSACLLRAYLVKGGTRPLLASALSSALVGLSHHFTFLLFLPAAALLAFIDARRQVGLRAALGRLFRYLPLSLALSALLLWPFISYLLGAAPMAEIPHGSREDLFSSFDLSLAFFWGMYGFSILLLPNAIALSLRRRRLLPLLAAFLLLFTLGLGGTTPLPRLLLGGLWPILTYDRFAFWASLLYVPLLCPLLEHVRGFTQEYYLGLKGRPHGERYGLLARAALLGGLCACGVTASLASPLLGLQPPPRLTDAQLAEVASFLNQQGGYGYITLGLYGQRLLLSAMVSAPLFDGGYNLAKSSPFFALSGVESVDGAKYLPQGLDFLRRVLAEMPSRGLRFVVSADGAYDGQLRDFGFVEVKRVEGPVAVAIWEVPGARPPELPSPPRGAWDLIWGLGPLAVLLALALLLAKGGPRISLLP